MSGGGLIVIGASHAAVQLAASARNYGFDGSITLLGEEQALPYQRPPLSKTFLLGKTELSELPLRGEAFYREKGIELVTNCPVEEIDVEAQSVRRTDGQRFEYDWLAICTGARVRRIDIPGADLDGVFYIRNLADSQSIRDRLNVISSVVVIGGGFIGLEAAAALRSAGKEVTVVEAANRVMGRAVGQTTSAYYANRHRSEGVRLLLSESVTAIAGMNGRVSAVLTAGGERIDADTVIIGVGVIPNMEIAQEAGLECADGIVVDRFARTSASCIVAAGDCTFHPNVLSDRMVRLESVQNANDQAKSAGASVAGKDLIHGNVCWFWSDQFDMKLQIAGLLGGYDTEVVRGDPQDGKFSVFYFTDGQLSAVDSINRPGDHIQSRKLLSGKVRLTPDQAADTSLELRSLV